jgi:putative tryptophan/tyrosine transport system substrate-binding protein
MRKLPCRPSTLRRRHFVQAAGVAGLGLLAGCGRLPFDGTLLARPAAARPRIGFLSAAVASSQTEIIQAFRGGLADYGRVEGRDIAIEWRFGDGAFDRLPTLAAELVALQVAVIVVPATPGAQVIQRATHTIPIVVAGTGGDLVVDRLATSFARPGGNVTGLSIPAELAGKRLQLLTEAAPSISRVAILRDANTARLSHADYEGLAHRVGLEIQFLDVRPPDELDHALASVTGGRAHALSVEEGPLLTAHRGRIVGFAAEHRLPTMYFRRLFVEEGGLMSYEPRLTDLYRRAAYYVDRILKGTNPAVLPIEQPMTFDFVINLQTAQALGLTIPQHVLLQATEIIQ